MLVKCLGTVMHGDDPLQAKAHPARRPIELDDEQAYRLITETGVAQPHGEAATKRVEEMRERKARERVRLAQQWRGDDERDDEPVEARAGSDEQARALEEMHNREQQNVAAIQRLAKGQAGAQAGGDDKGGDKKPK